MVIGAGGAGLAAALAAAQKGLSVLVLEKMPMLGGNTFLAAGYLLSAKSETPQATAESEKQITEDIIREGRGYADLQRVRE
ncbi:secreted protein containing Fumarate reductase/succinate dehydrogenase flavoprotein, partial [gut metagenome]